MGKWWHRSADHLVLGALLAAFLAFELAYPRLPGVDDTFFKAAGHNLSTGAAFAAPELEGFLAANPPVEKIYFLHPPIYTWLFGQFCKGAGFNWRVCVAYDALISAALAVILFAVARRLCETAQIETRVRRAVAAGVVILTLLLRQPGRPDELGMLFSYWSIFLLLGEASSSVARLLFAGVLAGLTLCTSIGVSIAFAPMLAILCLSKMERRRSTLALGAFASGAIAASAICLAPLYVQDPHFYRQFLAHADAITAMPPVERMRGAILLARQVAPERLLVCVAALPFVAMGAMTAWRRGLRSQALAWHGSPIAALALIFYLRAAHTYWWFLQPWLVIVALIVIVGLWKRRTAVGLIGAIWMATFVTAALAWPAKDFITRVSLPPEQQLSPATARLREIVPRNATILTSSGWAALASDHKVIDAQFSNITDLGRIEFFVADGNGTGSPGLWRGPANPRYKRMLAEDFEPIVDNLPRERVTLFGHTISSSAYGFGTIVMRRRDVRQ